MSVYESQLHITGRNSRIPREHIDKLDVIKIWIFIPSKEIIKSEKGSHREEDIGDPCKWQRIHYQKT